MLDTLSNYTIAAKKFIKEYINYAYNNKKSLYKFLYCSDELICNCVNIIVKADQKYSSTKSKLSLYQYRRMHVYYTIRSFIRATGKRNEKNKFLDDHWYDILRNKYHKHDNALQNIIEKEDKDRMIFTVGNSSLDTTSKKYVISLLKGKNFRTIAKENGTAIHMVKKIINSGVLKLNGE